MEQTGRKTAMKKRIVILAVITASFLLTACEKHETEKTQNGTEPRLIVVDGSMSYRIYVDKETKVMYLRTKQGYGEALCVMVDADGKPLLWKEAQQ